jgi:hypothetical protein
MAGAIARSALDDKLTLLGDRPFASHAGDALKLPPVATKAMTIAGPSLRARLIRV